MLREETNSYPARRQQKQILETARRIAVVDLKTDPIFKSYTHTQKLIEYGLEIAPVISNCESILGLACYGRVLNIPEPVDIVQFYTDGKADIMEAARDAIQKGAKAFWVETDVAPKDVRVLLKNAGVCLVEYDCLQKEYEQFLNGCAAAPAIWDWQPARHVRERMTRYPITMTPRSSIQSALEAMKRGHFRHLPVVDETNHLLAMFSDRDLRLMYPSPTFEPDEHEMEKFRATPVADAAAFNPVSILPDATLEDAADLMLRWNVEALPVIADGEYLVGIITVSDFLKEYLEHREQRNKHH